MLVVTFLIRGLLFWCILLVGSPTNWPVKLLVPSVFVLSISQFVFLDIVFFRDQPKNLRGALSGARQLFSNLVSLIYIYYAGF